VYVFSQLPLNHQAKLAYYEMKCGFNSLSNIHITSDIVPTASKCKFLSIFRTFGNLQLKSLKLKMSESHAVIFKLSLVCS